MNDKPKTLLLLGAIVLAALVGCALGCFLVIRFATGGGEARIPDASAHAADPHWRLHAQLGITEAQNEGLEAIEARFADRETALKSRLAKANAELGRVLKEDRKYSPRVEATVDEIHNAMAELQKATIEHLIEMEEVLTPEQFDHLLELTGEALSE